MFEIIDVEVIKNEFKERGHDLEGMSDEKIYFIFNNTLLGNLIELNLRIRDVIEITIVSGKNIVKKINQ